MLILTHFSQRYKSSGDELKVASGCNDMDIRSNGVCV